MLTATVIGITPALASKSPCNYDHKVDTKFTKTIQKSENVIRNVYPYMDNRKCEIKLDVTIDGQTYPTSGHFAFGPDMSENDACQRAELRAKTNIIKKVSPEVLTSSTDMTCVNENSVNGSTTGSKPVSGGSNPSSHANNNYPPVGTVISTEVVRSYPSEVIYESSPTVVYRNSPSVYTSDYYIVNKMLGNNVDSNYIIHGNNYKRYNNNYNNQSIVGTVIKLLPYIGR